MSIKKTIQDPLPNENVVDLIPTPDVTSRAGRRRLNLFTGRTLSHQHLEQEQTYRDTHLALLGQQRSPGVVNGLEAAVIARPNTEDNRPSPLQRDLFTINAGNGLSRKGQEVNLVTAESTLVGNLPVYTEDNAIANGTNLVPLFTLIEQGQTLPPAGIVLLQPITADSAGTDLSSDPCAIDVNNRAFDNLQLIDGARLIYHPWPGELFMPTLETDPSDLAGVNRWRSRLAYAIFSQELKAPLPWESIGVPIALIGFDSNWQTLFTDRHSVVRQGGRALQRPSLIPLSGSPYLWQARIEQFAEQLQSLTTVPSEQLKDYFAWLPPIGTLPNDIVTNLSLPDIRSTSTRQQNFFPSGYRIEAAPIPLEQVDLIFHESASLLPFGTISNDFSNQVKILVPVPDSLYDPDLLKVDQLDPEFSSTLTRFIDRRADSLNRRQIVRDRLTQLQLAISGTTPLFPSPDPNQLESSEKAQPDAPFPGLSSHQSAIAQGIHEHGFNNINDAAQELALQAGDRLITYVYLDPTNPPAELMLTFYLGNNSEHRAYWGSVNSRINRGTPNTASQRRIDALPTTGEWVQLQIPIEQVGLTAENLLTGMDFTLFDGRAAWGHTARLPQNGSSEPAWVTPDRVTVATTRLEVDEPWRWLTDAEQRSPFESRYGITLTPNSLPTIESLEALKDSLQQENSPIDRDAVRLKLPTTADGLNQLTEFLTTFPSDFSVEASAKTLTLSIRGILLEEEYKRLRALVNDDTPEAVRTSYTNAVDELFSQSQNNETLSQLDTKGLSEFIDQLERQVNQANDKIEFGFLQVRTDMYRIRQFVLGEEDASRLSVSPTLNAIAQRDTATAATADLSTYFDRIKGTLPELPDTPDEPDTPAPSEPTFLNANRVINRRFIAADTTLSNAQPIGPELARILVEAQRNLERENQGSDFSVTRFSSLTAIPPQPRAELISDTHFQPNQPLIITQPSTSAIRAIDFDAQAVLLPGIAQPTTITAKRTSNVFLSPTVINTLSQPDKKVFSGAPTSTIINQSPTVGKTYPNISIAERLREPPALEARNYTLSGRVSVITGLADTNLFKDIVIPGNIGATIGQVQNNPGSINADPNTIDDKSDEATFFSSSVRILDETVATLRLAEGRIVDYRSSLAAARRTLKTLEGLSRQGGQRLQAIEDNLAEARHDVATARALIAEEQQRLDILNQKRQEILANQVPFLLYHRPRTLGPDTDLPLQTLLPAVQSAGRPACLDLPWILPEALQAATQLLRQSPISWFTHLPPQLNRIDQPALLLDFINKTALSPVEKSPPIAIQQVNTQFSPFIAPLQATYLAQQQVISQTHTAAINRLNISELSSRSWLQIRDQATLTLTLGDLLNGKHNNSTLTNNAAKEFREISRALACLHDGFSNVSATTRLVWAERLSQFDQPVRLANLGSLPRWESLDELAKRELQAVTDWLYGRMNLSQSGARSLLDDLIRICILLASAAPVNQIIAGRIINPAPVKPGGNITIAINPTQVHIGMTVSLFGNNNQVIAEGIVEDLAAELATTRITTTAAPVVQLAENTQARFYRQY